MWNPFSEKALPKSWEKLQNQGQLDNAWKNSENQLVVLFKHSTRCSRSAFAKHKLEENYPFSAEQVKFYFLDLLAHRDISNEIAKRSKVQHQSPQIILLKNGKVVGHTSHEQISQAIIQKHI